jgi:thymidine kinase
VKHSKDILSLVKEVDVVGIDEAQFFDNNILSVCETLAEKGIRVIVAGLDMDYTGKPFGPMPNLLAIAEYITKLHAICMQCGAIANYSYRKTNQENQLVIGEKDHYEARCRKCFKKAD